MKSQHSDIKNDRSMINPQFMVSDHTSMIAVYGYGNSRTIYIETGSREAREITKYQIQFSDIHMVGSDASKTWLVSNLRITQDSAQEIRILKEKSTTKEEFQVSNDEMKIFKESMDDASKNTHIFVGDQDHHIQIALETIGRAIEFPAPEEIEDAVFPKIEFMCPANH